MLNGTVRGPTWSLEPFPFNKGVFQGDTLSPIIFLIVFDPIIQHLKIVESQYGYDLNGTRYITLPFAGDFCLITTHKRTHQRLMNELSELTASMNLTLKTAKCKSLSISSGKPKDIEFSIGDNKSKPVQEAPEKFLGVLITLYNKTTDHFEVVKSKLNSMIENINVSLICNEFKLRVYNEYLPSIRYLLMTYELTDTQLNSLDQIHTNAVKSWLQMKPKGPTPAILFSPDGLNLRRISDIYVESHTVL